MASITDLVSNFGDVIELDYQWNLEDPEKLITHPGWVQYNPRKDGCNRYGLSVTSADGGFSGIPDLDSLREYNRINGTTFTEAEFNKRTSIVSRYPDLERILNLFGNDCGRCHFLRLDRGGFFPPHRDNGTSLPSNTFRIIVPLHNFGKHQVKWIQEDKVLSLEIGRAYFVNTTKEHSVFSFVDNSIMFVMNIMATDYSIQQVANNAKIL
jgi:hypothetical protein